MSRKIDRYVTREVVKKFRCKIMYDLTTGFRSTFEFPSRVNLNRTSWCNKVDVVRLQVEFTFTEGSGVRVTYKQTEIILYMYTYI